MDSDTLCMISLNAYHRIYPNSFFRRILRKDELEMARDSLVFLGFYRLLELAKEIKDYFLILRVIEQNVDEVCKMLWTGKGKVLRDKFKKLKTTADREVLDKFEECFAEEEKKI